MQCKTAASIAPASEPYRDWTRCARSASRQWHRPRPSRRCNRGDWGSKWPCWMRVRRQASDLKFQLVRNFRGRSPTPS